MNKTPIHPYVVYSTKEAAELMGVDKITIQRYIRNGKLSATKLGNNYKITGQALLNIMSLESDVIKLSQDRVRQTEQARYTQSKMFLLNDTYGTNYIRLIDLTNNALLAAWNPDFSEGSEDELTIKYVGARIFNDGMSAYSNCLSGYYQISFAAQRDLIEIYFLLEMFRIDPSKIKEWRKADDKKLANVFSPKDVRKFLNTKDNLDEKVRKEMYRMYCKYAAHMTYAGFSLLTNDINQVEIGPFNNERKLLNCMYDLAYRYSLAVMSFIANLKSPGMQSQKLAIEHIILFHEVFKDKIILDSDKQKTLDQLQKMYSQFFGKV